MHGRSLVLGIACVLSAPFLVSAESVLWSTNAVPTLFCYNGTGAYGPDASFAFVRDINVDVSYGADATDDSGQPICGGTVPVGSKVHLKFRPHVPQDIDWFGTGYDHDSPYGAWVAGAVEPVTDDQYCGADSYVNSFGNFADTRGYYMHNESHVPLHIDPPSQSISRTGSLACGTPDANGNRDCTASSAGTSDVSFDFNATYGHFYFAILYDARSGWGCARAGIGLACKNGFREPRYGLYTANNCTVAKDTYTLQVPARSISCPITVVDGKGAPPQQPTVTAAGGACTVGTAYDLSMRATDPDGDQVRYLIDWNGDGKTDQVLPPSNYLDSGTTVTASRTFSAPGKKTVKIKAQDKNGLTSAWANTVFTCAGGTETSDSGFDSETSGGDAGGDAGVITSSADLTLSATPSLIRSGATTKLNWTTTHMRTCALSSHENVDAWDTLQSIIGGNVSSPITGPTTYTLACVGVDGAQQTKSVQVSIVPSWQEQ